MPSPLSKSILERMEPGKPISLERREACEAIRLFLFGATGHEGIEARKEKKKFFYDGEGTAEQCSSLYRFWGQLDPAFTGITGIYQFQAHLHHVHYKLKAHGQKVVSFLLSREKNRFSVEDIVRIIWPGSSNMELSSMKASLLEEYEKASRVCIVRPQLLPEEDREALTRIFKQLDSNREGMVSFQSLEDARDELDLPLVDCNAVRSYAATWDPEGSGYFGLEAFLQMMCPAGFYASAESKVAVSPDGDRICRSSSDAWYVCERG